MMKILLPIDNSSNSLTAVKHVVNRFLENRAFEVHLLHVPQRFSQPTPRFASARERAAYYHAGAEAALSPARELLTRYGVPHECHVQSGPLAQTIVRMATSLGASEIVMGTARKHSITHLLEYRIARNIVKTAAVPVEFVTGEGVSTLERFGVPAGVGAAVGLVVVAVE